MHEVDSQHFIFINHILSNHGSIRCYTICKYSFPIGLPVVLTREKEAVLLGSAILARSSTGMEVSFLLINLLLSNHFLATWFSSLSISL